MLDTATVPAGLGGRPVGARRRRRVAAALAATTAVLALASVLDGSMRWPAVAAAATTVAYLAAGAHTRHRAVRREVARAFSAPGGGFDWTEFARSGAGGLSDDEQHAARQVDGRSDLIRFLLASLLGWALTPVVVVVHLAGGDRRDLEGDGVLARVVALQRQGRAHSMRALAVSLATTAGAGAVGTLAGAVGAGAPAASAAPLPTAAPTPAAGSAPPAGVTGDAGAGTVTVAPGETLWGLAGTYGTTVAALAETNHLPDPSLITVGEVLVLPPGASAAAGAPSPARGAHTYTVHAGDTLSGIAASYGTTVSAIAAANHLADPNLIRVGEVLTIPGAGAASSAAPATPAPVGTAAAATRAPTPAATPVATTGGSAVAAEALRVALAQVGKPYQWGGAGPDSFDCSGLVMYSYEAAGVALPHYTGSQYADTARVAEADLQPGDLVFYGSPIHHVAMYDGDGRIVTADTTGTDVRVEPMTWDGTPVGFGRVG